MKATEAKRLDSLKKPPLSVLSIDEGTYGWSSQECRKLWDDILCAGRNSVVSRHFVESIVFIEKGLLQVSNKSPDKHLGDGGRG